MKKEEVQRRVLQNGNPLPLSKFTWDDETKTFSSKQINLVIDFSDHDYCTFDTCPYCTFDTGSYCTFKTGSYCTFDTGFDCTFDTDSDCTFETGSDCTFDTGSFCVIVNRNIFEVIQPNEGDIITICPDDIPGHLSKKVDEDKYYLNGDRSLGEHIIVDNILSKVINKRKSGDVVIYKVITHEESEESYLVQRGELFAHGNSISDCKKSIIYKISDRDTSKYESMTLDTVLSFEEQVEMYRKITGSCESMTKAFAEKREKKDRTIREVIEITKGQYNNDVLKKIFETKTE